MSTEPEPAGPTDSSDASTLDDPTEPGPPAEPDPTPVEPEPEEETETPPPPTPPANPITVEPATWYEVTSVCTTSTCPNLNTSTTEPMVYSNAGTIRMICARCSKDRLILSATKLEPQPEMS